ncbi:MAG: GNAT family N-acetyltransferase [Chloroflexi bacterium]|jgi:hypothetical protein|nr:GNAT family N-acetyltransferase [Chloroflexota bacterium]
MLERVLALIERYHGLRLDANLPALTPGRVAVVESPRRLRREQSYAFVHALWWTWLLDGRSVVSVPPGAGPAVQAAIGGVTAMEQLTDPALIQVLRVALAPALDQAGLPQPRRASHDLFFACDGAALCPHNHGECRRLRDTAISPAEGLHLPTHCFPDGLVYGVVAESQVVSVAYAHRTNLMEEQVADLGVETAPGYRRRGYAQTAVSAVVTEIARNGGVAYYSCSPDNHASAATARSVGFMPYGRNFVLSSLQEG